MFVLLERFTSSAPWWLLTAIAALDALAILRALLRGHGVSSTLAWILAVIAFPGAGALAYLLLANPTVGRIVRLRALAARSPPAEGVPPGPDGDGDAHVLRLAGALTGCRPTAGNQVELLAEDQGAFQRIEDALTAARATIWAEYYLVRNDETGRRFLAILTARAREGVEVRLLYDAVGSFGLEGPWLRALRAAGGRVAPFLPFNPFRRHWSLHLRNHRKLVVVDGAVAFTGGMNVGDEYSGRSRRKGRQHFQDSHLRIEGPATVDFAELFAEDWRYATGERLAPPAPGADAPGPGGAIVCPLPSGPDQRLNASAHTYFAGIARARRECFLTTPYFVPDEPTIRALVSAARGGVDVRVLVPARSDVPLIGLVGRSYHRELVRGGVRIFEYQPAMLHAKTMVVDGSWGIVGSANVDMRSFRLNFEIGAVVHDPAFAAALTARFHLELSASDEVSIRAVYQRRLGQRVLLGLARLLSPLL